MSVEEEIARALREEMKHDGDFDPFYDYTEDSERYTAALTPLLNRVRAEALREAANPFMDRLNGEGNGRAYNSYTVARLLRERAEAIEQNSEGNET